MNLKNGSPISSKDDRLTWLYQLPRSVAKMTGLPSSVPKMTGGLTTKRTPTSIRTMATVNRQDKKKSKSHEDAAHADCLTGIMRDASQGNGS